MNRLLDFAAELRLLFWFLLFAPIVCALLIWLIWRNSRRFGIWATAIVVLATATFVIAKSVSPAGKYSVGEEGIYTEENPRDEVDKFYHLSGGKAYLVVDGKRSCVASYYKTRQGWVWENMTKRDGVPDKFRIRFSVIGFDIVDLNGQGDPGWFNRRRVVPFARPRWMPDWLQ